jgi:methylated-DNA-[protein]-cysteine S-methyltransferase
VSESRGGRESGRPALACVETPIGPLTLVAGDGGLREVRWGAGETTGSHPVLDAAGRQLREYFAGERRAFELPLDVAGTPFQRRAWLELAEIPFGTTRTYGEQARRLGRPDAPRAVGAANGRNPLPIVLPCHRLVGADGSLTGYGGGLDVKRALLDHEARVLKSARGAADHRRDGTRIRAGVNQRSGG